MLNKVEICGVNTSKLPILSKEQKEELLKKVKNGDEQARTEFINGNLRLVLSVIQRFMRKRRKCWWFVSNRMRWVNKSYR